MQYIATYPCPGCKEELRIPHFDSYEIERIKCRCGCEIPIPTPFENIMFAGHLNGCRQCSTEWIDRFKRMIEAVSSGTPHDLITHASYPINRAKLCADGAFFFASYKD